MQENRNVGYLFWKVMNHNYLYSLNFDLCRKRTVNSGQYVCLIFKDLFYIFLSSIFQLTTIIIKLEYIFGYWTNVRMCCYLYKSFALIKGRIGYREVKELGNLIITSTNFPKDQGSLFVLKSEIFLKLEET